MTLTPTRDYWAPNGNVWRSFGGFPDRSPVPPPPAIGKGIVGAVHRKASTAIPAGFGPHLDATVIEIDWAKVQTTAGGAVNLNAAISPGSSTSYRDQINAATDLGLRMRVRFYTGYDAPSWAKNAGGSPIAIDDPVDGNNGTCGRWWHSAFRAYYYGDVMPKLLEALDPFDLIVDFCATYGSTTYGEPFIRQIASSTSKTNLRDAGYQRTVDQDCLRSAGADHAALDPGQRFQWSYAFNPHQYVTATAGGGTDMAFTLEAMGAWRGAFLDRGVLLNNSHRDPEVRVNGQPDAALPGEYDRLYDEMQRLGVMGFQTATAVKLNAPGMTGFAGELAKAVQRGAQFVELSTPAYSNNLTTAQLDTYRAQLKLNAPVASR